MSAAVKQKAATGNRDLVFGIGNTGLSVARFLKRNDSNAIFVDSRDEPPGLTELAELLPDAEIVTGKLPKTLLRKADRIVVSPGIADSDPFLVAARKAGVEVVSDIELFADAVDAPVVGVTGSNGKSTVTTLLGLMCEAAGVSAPTGGNLGVPALDLLGNETPDFYVLELSSFQLQRTRELPLRIAVLLNLSADHLDWHEDEAEYRASKLSIFDAAEHAVFNRDDDAISRRTRAFDTALSFGLGEPEDGEFGILEADGEIFLARGDQLLLSVTDVAMVGTHNHANCLAAMAAGQLMGLGLKAMLPVLHEFPGLPHRMQRVASVQGIDYVNDSKATNVGAAIASVSSLPGAVILIAGGLGKGGDFDRLATATCDRLRAVVLIGEDADLIESAFDQLTPVFRAGGMREAVQSATKLAESGDTVLLAPACSSFDQYPNYQARGDDFCRVVEALST